MPTVSFRYHARRGVESVSVVATFNDWNRDALPLRWDEGEKAWVGSAEIAPGTYEYRYHVNRSRWVCSNRQRRRRDSNNNLNNFVVVSPAVYAEKPGRRGDGVITHEVLRHEAQPPYVVRRSADEWAFELVLRVNDVERVKWVCGERRIAMKRKDRDDLFETWRCTVTSEEAPGPYHFELVDGSAEFVTPSYTPAPECFPVLTIPDWVKGRVFYQIFPDRFAMGSGTQNPLWGTDPHHKAFFGGNLEGVREHWDHLESLGIGGLYFTPIFEARSYHAYDTYDYEKVDARFGTNHGLKQLVKEAHDRGIKVMLDGVFNHSGTEFFAFRDLQDRAEASPYVDWFFDIKHPVDPESEKPTYRGWAGTRHMPKLNQDHPACREYFLGIGRKWIEEAGIDAWRLDVANEVSPDFWRAYRRAVRAVDPETYILGEHWGDARPWLQGDQWDSTMNYRWSRATLDLLMGRMPSSRYVQVLNAIVADYPEEAEHGLFNLLGSHDTARVATVLGNPDKVDLAFALLLTAPGVPCIYYGDEVGMEGGHDPDCRRCMDWSGASWNLDRFELVKALIALRNSSEALRVGATKLSHHNSGVFQQVRMAEEERVVLLANPTPSPASVPPGFDGVTLSRGYDIARQTLAPYGFLLSVAGGQ